MKHNTNFKNMVGIALGASLIGGAAWAAQSGNIGTMAQGCQKMMGGAMSMMGGMSCCAPKTDAGAAAEAKQDAQLQRATITVNDGYTPGTVNVQVGKPLELTFVARGQSCANTVLIPVLKQTFSLKSGEKKTLSFTPQKGTTTFRCSMGMYGGQIVAK